MLSLRRGRPVVAVTSAYRPAVSDQLLTRVVRRTGTRLTALSFGAAALGNLYTAMSDDDARSMVDAAWAAGIRYFDVAPHYGLGLAERRLGAALSRYPRDEYVLSTKVGRLLVPDPRTGSDEAAGFAVSVPMRRELDYSPSGMWRSLSDSLDRLGLDRVDIVYVHDPDQADGLPEQVERETLPTLCAMRDEGVVGAVGVGINQWQLASRFVQSTDLDLVLLAGRYTLLEQESVHGLLDHCQRREVGVVAAAAFNSGLLAADSPPDDATWNYQPAPPAVLARARAIADICRASGVPLPAAALQFPLGHPAVVSVLVGMRSPAEVTGDVGAMSSPVPTQLWERLRGAGLLAPDVPTP